jgi:uncharacterized protein YkwD
MRGLAVARVGHSAARYGWPVAMVVGVLLTGCEPSGGRSYGPVRPAPSTGQKPQSSLPRQGRPPAQPDQSSATARMEAEVVERINEIRREHGLQTLEPDERLTGIARSYSRLMGEKDFFSHTGPTGDSVADRVRVAGVSYRRVGENLFKSFNNPNPVPISVKGWMESPGHRGNILHPEYTHTGVGVWCGGKTCYFTQIFLRPG